MRRALCLLLVATACESGRESAASTDALVSCSFERGFPLSAPLKLDVLFVIDTAPSTADDAPVLAQALGDIGRLVETTRPDRLDLHFGIVSSDLARGGVLEATPWWDCASPDGRYLTYRHQPDGTLQQNFGGPLDEILPCIGALPATGSPIRQPLEAMRRALDPANTANAGFLRDDAFLTIVFITDGDDCSAPAGVVPAEDPFFCVEQGLVCDGGQVTRQPAAYAQCEPATGTALTHPQEYVDFLAALKDDLLMVAIGVVGGAGPGLTVETSLKGYPEVAPWCAIDGREGLPSIRLLWFLNQFDAARRMFEGVCAADWSEVGLVIVPPELGIVFGNPCLVGPGEDQFPDDPGIQPDCSVVDRQYWPQEETPLARCPMLDEITPSPDGPRPCWYVVADTSRCPDTESHLYLRVARAVWPPMGTNVVAHCALDGC